MERVVARFFELPAVATVEEALLFFDLLEEEGAGVTGAFFTGVLDLDLDLEADEDVVVVVDPLDLAGDLEGDFDREGVERAYG